MLSYIYSRKMIIEGNSAPNQKSFKTATTLKYFFKNLT